MINAAAYTAVDKAESEEDLAMRINGDGAGHVAEAAAKVGAPLLHLSTDYVFDGTLDRPYREDDPTGPTGAYGRTKLAGERLVAQRCPNSAILRTAWIYSPFGANFVRTMLRLNETRDEVAVVDDQRGAPTSALDIADALHRHRKAHPGGSGARAARRVSHDRSRRSHMGGPGGGGLRRGARARPAPDPGEAHHDRRISDARAAASQFAPRQCKAGSGLRRRPAGLARLAVGLLRPAHRLIEEDDMRNVLVTGGAGFIGSAVCRHLVGAGANVLNVDSLTYAGNLASLAPVDNAPNYRFARIDICDRPAIAEALQAFQPDHVIHLAAESHVDRSITGSDAFIQTNILGTFSMLEAARAYWLGLAGEKRDGFRFLHVSTDEVYGSLGEAGLFVETTSYDPSSPYSASKAASDHLVSAWAHTYRFPAVISNCSNNYGPYHFPEKLIPLVILNAVHGKTLPVYGEGSNVRDWLYVEDHARALDLIVSRGRIGEKYNIGGRNERRNIDVVRTICAILDRLCPGDRPHAELIEFVTDRPGHDQRYAIDATKLERELGWQARETFETGIEKTVRWYLDNEWWWRPLREKVYAGERLGMLREAVAAATIGGGA